NSLEVCLCLHRCGSQIDEMTAQVEGAKRAGEQRNLPEAVGEFEGNLFPDCIPGLRDSLIHDSVDCREGLLRIAPESTCMGGQQGCSCLLWLQGIQVDIGKMASAKPGRVGSEVRTQTLEAGGE